MCSRLVVCGRDEPANRYGESLDRGDYPDANRTLDRRPARWIMYSARVFEITTRVRKLGRVKTKQPKLIEGTLAELPRVGESIMVFKEDKMTRLITSTVIRILSDSDGTLYAQTHNSVYRIVLGKLGTPGR